MSKKEIKDSVGNVPSLYVSLIQLLYLKLHVYG